MVFLTTPCHRLTIIIHKLNWFIYSSKYTKQNYFLENKSERKTTIELMWFLPIHGTDASVDITMCDKSKTRRSQKHNHNNFYSLAPISRAKKQQRQQQQQKINEISLCFVFLFCFFFLFSNTRVFFYVSINQFTVQFSLVERDLFWCWTRSLFLLCALSAPLLLLFFDCFFFFFIPYF